MKFIKKWCNSLKTFDYLCLGLIIFYAIIACVVSIHRFWQFDAFHYDLGIYDAAIWKVSRFKAPIIDHLVVGGKWNFADHFTPSIFLFSPLYWLTSETEIILIAQAICVALGLFFGFLTARKLIKSKLIIVALIFAFMGYIGLQNAIIANFHPITAAIFPLMVCFWAIVLKKWKIFWLFLIILLGFQEDMFIIGCGLGGYLIFKGKEYQQKGIVTLFVSFLYGLIAIYLIIPLFAGRQFLYSINFKRPIQNWFIDFFWPVEKLKTMLVSFSTFGFLPLLYFPTLLIVLATFYIRFVLVGGRDGLGLHYNALVAPLMFMGAIEVVRIIEKSQFKRILNLVACLIILIVFTLHQFILHGALGLFFRHEFYANTKRNMFLNNFIDQAPKNGSVMTQNHLTPRFIHNHDQVFLIRSDYWRFNPNYIAIELRNGQNPNNFWPMNEEAVKEMVQTLKSDRNYQLIYGINEQYIFQRL